jgi:hypothetical protein
VLSRNSSAGTHFKGATGCKGYYALLLRNRAGLLHKNIFRLIICGYIACEKEVVLKMEVWGNTQRDVS